MYKVNLNKIKKTFFIFLLINYLISLFIALQYIFNTNISGFLSLIYVSSSLISNFAIIYLAFSLILSIIILAFPFKKIIFYLFIPLFTLVQLILFVDCIIYKIYHFHINSAVINIFTSGGFGDSVVLDFKNTFIILLIFFTVLFLEIFSLKIFAKFIKFSKKKIYIFFLIILSFILIDKFSYAVADMYNYVKIIRYSKVFPLYQTLTIKSFMEKTFAFKINKEEDFVFSTKSTMLSYPLKPLEKQNLSKYPNILWIFLDAMRFDAYDSTIMPNIYKFSKKNVVLNNHYSGGNASRFGVFSIFYALHGYYWHTILAERKSSVFIDELQKLNYDFYISASTRLTYPEFRKTAFINIPNYIHDELPGKNASEKDPELAEGFIEYLENKKNDKPFFSFLFFDAPHGFDYPEKYDKFKPSLTKVNYVTLNSSDDDKTDRMRNAYKNTIYFNDDLVGEIIAKLEEMKLLENTIVLISADHGQEFYENGFFGHCSAFSDYQTKVPLILHIPGKNYLAINKLTSHADIVPTIMKLLGYTSDEKDYCQGYDIFSEKEHNFVVSCGWDDGSIIDSNSKIIFSTESYNAGFFEIRDKDYKLIENKKETLKEKNQNILQTMREFKEFFK